ncbi:Oryzin [Dactylella cylindrospora]|nr:Oryzin [Dactylella cylindrospora]
MRPPTLVSLLTLAGLVLQVAADLSVLGAGGRDKIPNSYIVVLKSSTNQTQVQEHTQRITGYHSRRSIRERDNTVGIKSHFGIESTGFKGYAVECDGRTLSQILRSPEVAYVEQEGKTKVQYTQRPSTWGLARISHKDLPWPYVYRYQGTWAGKGTTVYILDTGVRVSHKEFEGRAKHGYNAVGGYNADRYGHGTHVAGTVAGKTYGVAKKANIVAVKVLNDEGNGRDSQTIAGLNYVEALYKKGIIVVVAAGNDGVCERFLN